MHLPLPIQKLLSRGVVIPCPAAVEVDEMVDPQRIAPGAIIHAGSRILGASTAIGPESEIGAEAPATVDNCQLGRKVDLKGGYFSGATFLDGANMGSAAHIRPGTLLEEEAGGAHAVGLKQTIFLPFVTAGSLINFCDCLMSGGINRKNHSEIGSSYIHFNYTPHQDKATPSLIGDVPRGVMLDQPSIFLGGQGGLVGPVRIGFGTIIPAGTILRNDAPEGGQLLCPAPRALKSQPFQSGAYRSIRRIVLNNLIYLGNVRALQAWYQQVRRLFTADDYARACHEGALGQLKAVASERIKRLKELAEKMPHSIQIARAQFRDPVPPWVAEQEQLSKTWPAMEQALKQGPADHTGAADRDRFLAQLGRVKATDYLNTIRALTPEIKQSGTAWLQAIVREVSAAGAFNL